MATKNHSCPHAWARSLNATQLVKAKADLYGSSSGVAFMAIKQGERGWCNPAGFREFAADAEIYVYPDVEDFRDANLRVALCRRDQIDEAT